MANELFNMCFVFGIVGLFLSVGLSPAVFVNDDVANPAERSEALSGSLNLKNDCEINVNGEEAFRSVVNVFDVLRDLINGLENPDTTTGTTQIVAQISPLTDSLTQIQSVRAATASTFTRLETTENQLADFKLKVEQLLSDAEDADIASAIVELQTQETAYQISLATAARIIQSSLLDFLR